ncbi:cell wall assembly regulator SMI1 [Kroppenstedtia sanguinis]|uniref:SMI1/KNR4 family protein n=1 Tax=Kroppenstedtia sanguinis TaxID=1380684 RepID=A0ABW4C8T9_9BACL
MEKPIIWKYSLSPISEEVLREKEQKLGIQLPEDFRKVFVENHGGIPFPSCYYLDGCSMSFGQLLTLMEGEEELEFLEANTDIHREEIGMSENVIIFATDPAGNYLCFDYNQLNDGYPAIIFWDHEVEGGNAEKICNTFTELLDMLHDDEED